VTLGNERVSLSGEGALWGRGPTAHDLVELVRRAGGARNPVVRDRLVSLFIEAELLRVLRLRWSRPSWPASRPGRGIGAQGDRRRPRQARDGTRPRPRRAGGHIGGDGSAQWMARAPDAAADPQWSWGYLFSPALTIGGGTSEVQRNIIAERVLGLARELNT